MRCCRWLLWLIPLMIASAGCKQPKPLRLTTVPKELAADDFSDVLKRWTRSAKLYQALDDRLFVDATFHSAELRRAFALAFPHIYGHGGTITRRELVELSDDVEQYHTFFVSVYTPDRKWNDFAKPDSIWRITLVAQSPSGEVTVEPTTILGIRSDANLREVYSHIDRFDEIYLIRFPLADPAGRLGLNEQTTRFSLRVGSALGSAQMNWDVEPVSLPTAAPATAP